MLLLSSISLIIVASLTILFSIGINSLQVYADPTYRIAATGDIGCSTNGQNTVNQIKNQNPNLVLWLGDLSYVDANIDCFISQTSQLASKDEAVIGNHDDSEDGSSAARTQTINYFGLPSNGYYSKTFDVIGTQRTDDILLVGMDTQSPITSSSSQFTFVKNSLQNSNSPLKIVIVHKPFLSCSCSHSPNGQFNTYQAIFKQFGVDIVLQAHNHNIQYFNPIDNVKYIVSGAGGRSHYSLTSSPQPAHYRNSANYGFTLIDADFASNEFQGKFITNSGVDQTSSHFTQSFFVNQPQAPPVANNQAISTNKNTAKDITLTATDVNNDILTYTVVTPPAHGTLSGTAPNLNYNPNTDYVGPDSFTFKANDGTADSNTATVSITVQDTGSGSCTTNLPISGVTASGNDGNVPQNVLDNNLATRWSSNGVGQFITADLGAPKTICSVDIAWYRGNERSSNFVIATSTDGTTFTNVFSGSSSGTTLNSEKYTFANTPNVKYVRVTVNGNTANTWASITELDIFGSSSNSPPVASSQTVTTNKNTAKAITLTATDADNNLLTYTVVTPPAHGTLSGTAPNLNYNPNTDYVGPDSFTFKANDGTADSNTAKVSITVQDTGSGSCTANLPISGVTASGNDGNVPQNVLDNNLATRWSSNGIGQFITADLGSPPKNICSVDIAWYRGNERSSNFVIATSTDGTTFTNVFSGSSSGTTLNSEKYTFTATNARYVRVTVNGNTANTWASITELDIFGTGSATPSNTDPFGIIKLYPTKNGGEEWYMNMNNPLGDSRFNPQNTITKNPDGSWKMKSTQVRMNVYTSTGYDSNSIPTLDHSVIASKGYMLAPNDWKNFEMTQYVKENTSPSEDNFSPNGRGGRHTGSGPPEGCEGSSMKGDVFFSGQVRFAKEQWHVSYVFTNLKTATGSIEDKWVGIKFIVYNFVENNKVVVKTELWLDANNNGNFVKVDENVDRGGWGTEGTACGDAPDQIISWGEPITTFRWDTATDVDFKNLSVREIVPPQ